MIYIYNVDWRSYLYLWAGKMFSLITMRYKVCHIFAASERHSPLRHKINKNWISSGDGYLTFSDTISRIFLDCCVYNKPLGHQNDRCKFISNIKTLFLNNIIIFTLSQSFVDKHFCSEHHDNRLIRSWTAHRNAATFRSKIKLWNCCRSQVAAHYGSYLRH